MNAPPPLSPVGELRRLAELAWPVVIGQLGMVGLGVVDVMMVGRLGEEAIGAVGIGNTWSFAGLIFGLGTASGIDPIVTQAFGAGEPRAAGRALLGGAAVLSLLCVPIALMHLLSGPAFALLNQPESLVPIAAAYCRVIALGVPAFLGFALVRQFLQGKGLMRPAMWVLLAGNVLNVVLNDALIFGRYGLPALGVEGAAWSTVIVRWAMFGLLLLLGWSVVREARPDRLPTVREIGGLASLALPSGWHVALEVWAFGSIAIFAGQLGNLEVAAHTIAMNIISVLFMVPLGLSAAAATRVGNLVGARAPWTPAARVTLAATAVIMTTWSTVLMVLPAYLVGLYTEAPDVTALAVSILPIAAAFQLFDGAQIVSVGMLRGLGDTRRPAMFNLFAYWTLGVPLGWFLAFPWGLGLHGLWMGVSVGLGLVSVLFLHRLRTHARTGVVALV